MRITTLALSCLLSIVTACATTDTPMVDTASSNITCPTICGDGTPCRLPTGVCTEACNPCLCQARGGTVDATCALGEDDAPDIEATEAATEATDVSTAAPAN
jgi:hypothetical protein